MFIYAAREIFMKITDIKEILSEKCRFSGIRSCMAAGALTAGIAAFAFISGVNSDSAIASVSAEDKAAENISIAAVPDSEEKREYAHDREYFSYEEMRLMAIDKESDEESEETEAQAEETEAQETEVQSVETESEPEETEVQSAENEAEEAETQAEESEEEAEEQPAETEAPAEEPASENSNVVSERNSAANGDEDDGGLSSALDIDITPVPAAEYELDPEISFEEAAMEAQAINEAIENTEADNDTVAVVYENNTEEAEPAQTEEQPEETEDEDLSEIPEDITLDDEEGEKKSAPQEGAISLFDLPQWLEFDENGLPSEYKEVLTGKACAYTAEPGALMSTGDAVFQGYVAVDPDIIPYGSELYIVAEDGEVYGYAIAGDTGYSVKAGHIIVDLFMNEYDDCIQWGNKPVNVYVLK